VFRSTTTRLRTRWKPLAGKYAGLSVILKTLCAATSAPTSWMASSNLLGISPCANNELAGRGFALADQALERGLGPALFDLVEEG
jgi:hypothetical protein